MKVLTVSFVFLVVCGFLLIVNASTTHKSSPSSGPSSAKVKPIKLNVDILPPLMDVLEELQLKDYLKNFIKMGVTETRLLLRLSSMDFQMMSYDWPEFTQEKLAGLKEKIASLLELATIHDAPENPELEERRKLHYGRIYLQHGVTSYEYQIASFGSVDPPIGYLHLDAAHSPYACPTSSIDNYMENTLTADQTNYQKRVILVKRGNCPFVEKALFALAHNASGIIIVNNEDKIDSPSSGIGIYNNITDAMLTPLKNFIILSVSNTSGESLYSSVKFHSHNYNNINSFPSVAIVPLKCHTGGKCLPVTKEEQQYNHEVLWGKLRIRSISTKESKTFEFLTSNFGGDLPVNMEYPLQYANPLDLCDLSEGNNTVSSEEEIIETSSKGEGIKLPKIFVAYRGKCRFDVKTLNAQKLGGRALVIIDAEDYPLQRLGGMFPDAGYIGIPSVIVTAEVDRFLASLFLKVEGKISKDDIVIEFFPSKSSDGFDNWLEVAFTEWSEDEKDRLLQLQGLIPKYQETENHDIVSWLNRRIMAIEYGRKKSVETDAAAL
jgi:hypothetical protein